MGTNPKGCFLSNIRRRSLVVFKGRKVGFFRTEGCSPVFPDMIFEKNILLVVWDGVFGENRWIFSFYLSFFLSWYGNLMKIFSQDFFNKIYHKNLGMENFQHKNLTKRTKNVLFKIEHLIHLTKTNKNINFYFFVCLNFLSYFFMYMIKILRFNK